MVVALSVPRLLTVVTDRSIMLTGAGVAATGLLVAAAVLVLAAPTWPVLTSTWVLLGAATSMVNTPAGRLLRRASTETTPDRPVHRAVLAVARRVPVDLSDRGPGGRGRRSGAGRRDSRYPRFNRGARCGMDRGAREGGDRWAVRRRRNPDPSRRRVSSMMDPRPHRLDAASDTFRMLADPTRLDLLWLLTQGEADVCAGRGGRAVPAPRSASTWPTAGSPGWWTPARTGGGCSTGCGTGTWAGWCRRALNHADHRVTGEPPHA